MRSLEVLGDARARAASASSCTSVPRNAQLLGQVELEQPVVTQHLERQALALDREGHAAVGHVLHQPLVGELAQHRRHRAGRDAEALGQQVRADRLSTALALQRVDRLRVVLGRLAAAVQLGLVRLHAHIMAARRPNS